MPIHVRPFDAADYAPAYALWRSTPGVGLSDDDDEAPMLRFLARNHGLCFVAESGDELLGTILCGHDGRRGLIHHLVVAPATRRQGVARALLKAGLSGLHRQGIGKAHLLVFQANAEGLAYWRAVGATERRELAVFSIRTSGEQA